MSEGVKTIDLMPTRVVLIASVIAGLGAYAMKYGNPAMEAGEHLVANIIGRNMARDIESTDGLEGITLKETDYYTAGLRAGVSAFQKKGQNNIMWSAFGGLSANLIARWVDTKMVSPL